MTTPQTLHPYSIDKVDGPLQNISPGESAVISAPAAKVETHSTPAPQKASEEFDFLDAEDDDDLIPDQDL